MQSVKLVCVGDGTYKTRLLIAYTTNVGDPEYIPTVFDNYTAAVIIDGKPISAGLWDTAGQTDYDRLRPLSYPQTDVFLLVFSVLSPTSFQNAVTKWYEEVNFHCPSAEILLIGTEIEGRSGNIQCVTREEAMAEAKKIHAVQYMECSCATLQGVSKVFEEALRAAISPDTVRKQSAFSSYKSLHKLEGFISSGKWKDASKMLLENGVRQSDIEGLAEMATQKHGKKAAEFLFILYKREFLNPTGLAAKTENYGRNNLEMSIFALCSPALKDSPNAGLSLKDCALQIFFLPSQVPPTHPTIRNLQELDLSGNLLQSFPSSFFEFAPSLVRLNLSKNNLKAIPSGISHSSLLEAVNLSGNSIDRVQEWRVQSGSLEGEIFKLPALAELNLEDNRLTSVPLTLVQLALRPRFTLKLGGNTGLAIPPEALTDSADLVQYFTSLLKGEMIPWETVKLVTVGQENVGKTSLLGKLQNLITDGMSTDGICIGNLALGQTRFSTWDFGGQEVYYPTHQFFLTGCALYLVLFNLFNEEQSRIDYWLKQIHSLASRSFTRIILVATHVDEWTEGRNLLDVHLKPILDRYRKFGVRDIVGVSCTTGAGLGNLCSLLTQLSARPEFHRHVHTYWCRLAKEIDERRAVKPYLTWNEYIELAQSCGFETNIQRECENAASFLHEMGVLLHFKDPLSDLGNIVIINPQWLADVMATIITTKGNFVINGTLDHSNLAHLWKGKYPIDMHESLLRLLSFFGVMFPMRCSPPKSLVPCLLDEEIPLPQAQRAWPKLTPRGMTETSRMYTFPSLPLGFFGRIVARLLYLDIVPLVLWRYGMVATVNSVNTVLLLYKFAESSSIHSVHSLSLSLRSVSRMAYAVASEMISESINGTVNCFYENVASEMAQSIVCPGCIKSLDGISDQLSELVKPQGPPEPVLIPDLTKEDIVKTGELFSFSLMDVIRKFLGGCDSIPCPGIKKFRRLQIVEGIDHRTMHEPYYTPHTGGNNPRFST
ncbi:Rho GTPase [Pelomyxa schiedti]|nr:Rho GTPase [Pelomyxa schiedti]